MKKHAYLIMAHNEFHMLRKLLNELDDERNDIYIHIDRKTRYVNTDEIASWVKSSKVFFTKRINVHWGHISVVKCELELLKAAAKEEYHYYHLISGLDFPLKTQDEIHDYLENENSEFLNYHLDGEIGDSFLYKIRYYYPLMRIVGKGEFDGPGKKKALLRKFGEWQWWLVKFQERKGINRLKDDVTYYKSSQWFSITHDFVEYILANKNRILRKYRLTNTPDEFFVIDLAMNSHFAGRVKNNNLREIDWERGTPYEYTCDDLERLEASDAFFARKISFDRNPDLVKGLICHLHNTCAKDTNPLISVIVPCYNVGAYLGKCIDSLIEQTYSNLEILIIDDGSTDGSAKLMDEYAKKYEDVHCRHRENGGLSAARNTGLELAKGEYISFVDADDWVEPEFIKELYDAIRRSNSGFSVCGYVKEEAEKGVVSFDRELTVSSHETMRILGDIYPKENVLTVIACNKLYKRELFKEIRFAEGKIHEDEFLAHRIVSEADSMAVIAKPLYHYRIREGSITAPKKIQDLRHLDYLDALGDRIDCAGNMFFGDLLIYMIYTYYEGMKQLMVRYSQETIRDNSLYSLFRRKAAAIYMRCFFEMDSYQRRDYLKLILFPKEYRDEVIRNMGKQQ